MTNVSFRTATLALAATASLLLVACSTTEPLDAGHRISERGGDISARGQSWSEGQSDQQKGEEMVKRSADRTADSERDLRKAHAAVTKAEQRIQTAQDDRISGEQLISSGTQKMQKAEADYAAIKAGPAAISPVTY